MKNKVFITLIGLILTFLVLQNNIVTVLAQEDPENNISFTRDDALQALNESREIIDEMTAGNFSGAFVGDLLIEAERTLQQVDYAEILRGNINTSTKDRNEAAIALKLVNWRYINYSDVLEYTDDIAEIRELAFFIQDLLSIQKTLLGAQMDESGNVVAYTKVEDVHLERFKFLINEIEQALAEARYEEARVLAEELKEETDLRRTEVFIALALARGFGNIVVEYWHFSLLILIILTITGYYSSRIIRKKLLIRKIYRLKTEEKVLLSLIKKTQTERFKEGKISELVYNIRMEKFKEKLNSAKEDIPVLEKKLASIKIINPKKKE